MLCTNDRRRVLLSPTGGAHFRARAERIFAGTEVPVDESDSAVQSVLRRPGQRLGKSIRAMFAISSASCVATCKIHAGHFFSVEVRAGKSGVRAQQSTERVMTDGDLSRRLRIGIKL